MSAGPLVVSAAVVLFCRSVVLGAGGGLVRLIFAARVGWGRGRDGLSCVKLGANFLIS